MRPILPFSTLTTPLVRSHWNVIPLAVLVAAQLDGTNLQNQLCADGSAKTKILQGFQKRAAHYFSDDLDQAFLRG